MAQIRRDTPQAMSQANLDLVRRCFDCFARRDWDGVRQCFDPEVETIEPDNMPGARSYRGYAGLVEAYEHWAGQWDAFSVEVERLTDVGERVVVLVRHAEGGGGAASRSRRLSATSTPFVTTGSSYGRSS